MATPEEIREAQRQADRASKAMEAGAKQSPLGPAQRERRRPGPDTPTAIAGEPSTTTPPAPAPTYGAGPALSQGDIDDMAAAAERSRQRRAMQAPDGTGRRGSLDYMGHFANDDVMRKGHNTGMKPKGAVTSPDTARRGYRKLEGEVCSTMGKADHPSRYTDRPPVTVESPQMPLKPQRVKNPGKQ